MQWVRLDLRIAAFAACLSAQVQSSRFPPKDIYLPQMFQYVIYTNRSMLFSNRRLFMIEAIDFMCNYNKYDSFQKKEARPGYHFRKIFYDIAVRALEWLHLKSLIKQIIQRILFYNIPRAQPKVLRKIPHSLPAFTQGLYHDGSFLYESTGLYNESSLRKIDQNHGTVLNKVLIEKDFAEGIAAINKTLVQLTWKSGKAFIYKIPTLKLVGEFHYSGEGWGLTAQNDNFIMSNGTEFLCYRNTAFEQTGCRKVKINGFPLKGINDLVCVGEEIYANVLHQIYIFMICEKTGRVQLLFDCSELEKLACARPGEDMLNGIAYDKASETFFITGKNWEYIFQVRLEPVAESKFSVN